MATSRTAAPRNPNLAKIHIAKKQLGMDDATYRAMLLAHGGVSSSKDLTLIGAAKVLAHLERCGFKPTSGNWGKRPAPAKGNAALIGKVEAQLADAGRAWAYADGLAQKMFKVEKVVWLNAAQLMKIVAALAYDAKRRAKKAASDAESDNHHAN